MSEIRYDYLHDRWVVISPKRAYRPEDFKTEKKDIKESKICPFDYRNEPMTPPEVLSIIDEKTKKWKLRVVFNKYPILEKDLQFKKIRDDFYKSFTGYGIHEIIIDTPEHNKKMHQYKIEDFKNLFFAVQNRIDNLSKNKDIKYIYFFKNYGKMSGASLSHPHSQIIATPILPKGINLQLNQLKKYYDKNKKCYLCEEINVEQKEKERVITENEDFIAYCPFASAFPFEIRIMPKSHSCDFTKINNKGILKLSSILKEIFYNLSKNLNEPDFNLILYTSPTIKNPRQKEHLEKYNHWYIEILPRITTLGGFELGTQTFVNIIYPENAAKILKGI